MFVSWAVASINRIINQVSHRADVSHARLINVYSGVTLALLFFHWIGVFTRLYDFVNIVSGNGAF